MSKESFTDRVCANCLWWYFQALRPGVEITEKLEARHKDQVGECRGDRPQLVAARQIERVSTLTDVGTSTTPTRVAKIVEIKYRTCYPRPRGDKTCPDGVFRKAWETEGVMEPFFDDDFDDGVENPTED